MKLKRYDLVCDRVKTGIGDWDEWTVGVVENGNYVRYDDYMKLMRENRELRDRLGLDDSPLEYND